MVKYKETIIDDFCGDVNRYFNAYYNTSENITFICYKYMYKKFMFWGHRFDKIKPELNKFAWLSTPKILSTFMFEHIGWYIENYDINSDDILYLLSPHEENGTDDMVIILNKDNSTTTYLSKL